MIIAAKIRPRIQSCEECYTMFEAGSLIYHSDTDGKDYCHDCLKRKIPTAFFGKVDIPYTRYIAEGEPGVLVTGKLMLERTFFARMANGVYGLKQIDKHLVVNSVGKGDISLSEFMSEESGNSYVLEKRDEHALLYDHGYSVPGGAGKTV